VQDGGDDGLRIHVQVGKDVRDRDRMRDIGLAAQALLPLVSGRAEFVSIADPIDLLGRQVGFEFIEELRDAYRASSGRQEP
jgi:hypothetical protein